MFKPTFLNASIAAALILPLPAANLILNGDFSGGDSGTFAAGSNTTSNSVPTDWTGFATGPGEALLSTGDNRVKFNGNNQPTGNYVEQSVTTTANRWYSLGWNQVANATSANYRAGVTSSFWNGSSTGAADSSYTARWVGDRQSLFRAGSASTTVRLSDVGAVTTSADTYIDNVNMDLANGQMNISSLATAAASSVYGSGTWGRLENAIDGGTGGDSSTVFHSNVNTGGDWYELDFSTNLPTAFVSRIEIEARSGFNDRLGNTLDIYSTSGSLIQSIAITDGASYGINGSWSDVGRIRITEAESHLNLAEVRVFSEFVNGVAVPEPSSTTLLGLGGLALILRRRR